MNDTPSHSTHREWRSLLTNPVALTVMGGVAALLTIIGPFGTDMRLHLLPRFGYWLAMVVLTYLVGLGVNRVLERWTRSMHATARVMIVGLATGIAVTPVVTALNLLTFGYFPSADEWPPLLLQVLGSAVVITLMFEVLPEPGGSAGTTTTEAGPALMDRLALDKRGALLSLSSEDHYTRIRTARGEELVLLRLADAIREAAPTQGLQVHRSHWVALKAVTAARRDGDRAILTLSDGTEIPVSRANVPVIREAGLLPR